MYPNGINAMNYSRHIIGLCDGMENAQMILYRRERGAHYFDLANRLYATRLGTMDDSGCVVVTYVVNNMEAIKRVQYPQMIILSDLSFATSVKNGRAMEGRIDYRAVTELRRQAI